MTTGSDSGVWGSNLNTFTFAPLDAILGATVPVTLGGTNVTLTLTQWVSGGAFKLTGLLTSNVILFLPLSPNSVGSALGVGGKFIIDNECTGNFTVTVKTAATSSTGVTVAQGARTSLYSDTVNVWYADDGSPVSFSTFAGNPNGSVAGIAGGGVASVVWDTTDNALWVCSTGGSSSTAVWFQATGDWVTGDVKQTIATVAPVGWVMMNDGTIGSASSGATVHSATTQALFTLLFNNISDANCPLLTSVGGATTRGALGSAASAWAANCRMTLPLALGRAFAGAGTGAGLTTHALGSAVGEETHALLVTEMPAHTHAYHDPLNGGGSAQSGGGQGGNSATASTGGAGSTSSGGSGAAVVAHNTIQPTTYLNVMIKL